jgi:hypothetical protein
VYVTVIEYRTENGIFSGELRGEIGVLGKRLLKLSGRLLKLGFEALGVELVLHCLGSLYLGGCMALQKLAPLMRMQFAAYHSRGEGPHWFSVMKAALNLIGPPVGDPCPPVLPLEEQYRRELIPMLTALGYTIHAQA